MGTTAQKLTYTANAINGIKNALEERGIVVGDTPLGDYASLIESISTDGTTSFAEKALTEVTARMIGGITQIGDYAFYNQANLTTIEIPSTVTSIGDYAFYGCASLTTIYFSGSSTQWSSVTKGTNWDGNTGDYTVVFGSLGLAYTSNGDGTCSVSGIGTCTDTDLVIPLTSPDGDSVTSIGDSAFYGCSGLTSVIIPNSVTSIGYLAFYNCSGLTSLTIPDGVTSIGASAFLRCTGLISVTWNATNCIYAGEWNGPIFNNCTSLTTVTFGDNVETIPAHVFYICTSLTLVTIGNSVTSIGNYAFYNCSGLTSISILAVTPPTLTNKDVFANTSNCPIYVPTESVSAYKAAKSWSNYASRIQAIPT